MLAGLARPEIKFDCRTESLSSSLELFNENGRGKTTNFRLLTVRNSTPKPSQGRMCWWTRWTTCRDDGITICSTHKFYITLLDNRQQVLSAWKFKFVVIFNFYTLQFNKLLSRARSRVDAWSCGCLESWCVKWKFHAMIYVIREVWHGQLGHRWDALCGCWREISCKAKLNFIHEKLTLIFRWFGFVHTSSFDQVPMCRRKKSWNFQISRHNFTRHIFSLFFASTALSSMCEHADSIFGAEDERHRSFLRLIIAPPPPRYIARALDLMLFCVTFSTFRLCVRVWSSQKRVDESKMGRTARGERRKMGNFLTMMMMTATRAQRASNLSPPLQVSIDVFFSFFRLFLFSWPTME